MQRCIFWFTATLAAILPGVGVHPLRAAEKSNAGLRAGFAETDITPTVGANPVYMAGFGQNRKATRVQLIDPGEIQIGMPVELVWEDMSAELAIPRFRPRAP